MKLNREKKVDYKRTELTYLGHITSREELKADPKKIDACKTDTTTWRQSSCPAPTWNGRLSAEVLSEIATPLKELVKKKNNFRWDKDTRGKGFEDIKRFLSESPVLRFFDANAEITLQCDASDLRLGACLLAARGTTCPIHVDSIDSNRAQLSSHREGYAGYCLRIGTLRAICVRKTLWSGHGPQAAHSETQKESLLSATKRLQRMLLKTQKYEYSIRYKNCTEMYLVDTLSRAMKTKLTGKGNTEKEEIFQRLKERSNTSTWQLTSQCRKNVW